MPGNNTADLGGFDETAGGFNALDAVAIAAQAGHFTVLDDINAEVISRAGITPGNGIMAGGAAAFLQEPAHHGIADRLVDIDDRHKRLDLFRAKHITVNAVQLDGMDPA